MEIQEIKGCFNTPLEHTPSNLCQNAKRGISFIIGVAGGLPIGCAISGCVETTLEDSFVACTFKH